jgi:hypothetical protein
LLDFLCTLIWNIASTIAEMYAVTSGWVWPFNLISGLFYNFYFIVQSIAWRVMDFNTWVTNLIAQLSTFINWSTLWSWFSQFYDMIATAWTWVVSAWSNVTSIVSSWWAATSTTVLGWINTAVQGFQAVKVAWDYFWTQIFPGLVSFLGLDFWWTGKLPGITALILSTLKTAFPFYDELVQLWGDIKAFFTDPLQWVYNKLDAFFERFW